MNALGKVASAWPRLLRLQTVGSLYPACQRWTKNSRKITDRSQSSSWKVPTWSFYSWTHFRRRKAKSLSLICSRKCRSEHFKRSLWWWLMKAVSVRSNRSSRRATSSTIMRRTPTQFYFMVIVERSLRRNRCPSRADTANSLYLQ